MNPIYIDAASKHARVARIKNKPRGGRRAERFSVSGLSTPAQRFSLRGSTFPPAGNLHIMGIMLSPGRRWRGFIQHARGGHCTTDARRLPNPGNARPWTRRRPCIGDVATGDRVARSGSRGAGDSPPALPSADRSRRMPCTSRKRRRRTGSTPGCSLEMPVGHAGIVEPVEGPQHNVGEVFETGTARHFAHVGGETLDLCSEPSGPL